MAATMAATAWGPPPTVAAPQRSSAQMLSSTGIDVDAGRGPHLCPAGNWPQFRITTGAGFDSPSPVTGLPVVVPRTLDAAACASTRVLMFGAARWTTAPIPRTDTWTCDSAMLGPFVKTIKTSQDCSAKSNGVL